MLLFPFLKFPPGHNLATVRLGAGLSLSLSLSLMGVPTAADGSDGLRKRERPTAREGERASGRPRVGLLSLLRFPAASIFFSLFSSLGARSIFATDVVVGLASSGSESTRNTTVANNNCNVSKEIFSSSVRKKRYSIPPLISASAFSSFPHHLLPYT